MVAFADIFTFLQHYIVVIYVNTRILQIAGTDLRTAKIILFRKKFPI